MTNLRDILDLKEWQKIQDNFSAVTNVGLRTIDNEGNLVIPPSGQPRLCTELLKDSGHSPKACELCLPTFLGGVGVVDKNLSFSCISPLNNFITPLKVEDKIIGYLIIGPVILLSRHQKAEYKVVAEQLHVDLDEFWSAIVELKVVSIQGAHSLIELVKDIADYIQKLAYQSLKKNKENIVQNAARLNKLLDLLLDVGIQVSGADTGSVMFFDKLREELTIKASHGLSEDVVKNTSVRLGEGISGVAAREKISFLIDQDQSDNRITQYLKRPSIKSSMVVPIKVENQVVGIINLGTSEAASEKFNSTQLQIMNKLADLASLAFQK